jgi:hypothetical protein
MYGLPASNTTNQTYHDMGMASNMYAIPQAEKVVIGPLGEYPPGFQLPLDQVVPPMPPTAQQAPSNHPPTSLMTGPTPPQVSGSSPPASWSPMPLISKPNGKCNYVSPDGKPCKARAKVRHWATKHALREFKSMCKSGKRSKCSLGWLAGTIINSKAKASLADKYILRCTLESCATSASRQEMYPRRECLERHMCKDKTVMHAADGFSEEVAKEMVTKLICGSSPGSRNRWEKFIYRIHQL